jgi:hypothetical protein
LYNNPEIKLNRLIEKEISRISTEISTNNVKKDKEGGIPAALPINLYSLFYRERDSFLSGVPSIMLASSTALIFFMVI